MKHIQPIAIIILLCIQVFLMVKINRRDERPMLEAAQRIAEQNDSLFKQGQLIIAHIDAEIGSRVDTVRFYERQRTFIQNNYAKDLTSILRANSGQQFDLYCANTHRFDSLLTAGFFTAAGN